VLVFNRPDLLSKLQPHFDARDLVQEYERGSIGSCSTDLLTGKASAVVSAPAQAIDNGALAFIVEEAGGVVSDERGMKVSSYRASPRRILPCVVASADQALHEQVLRHLTQTSI
jgi:fructose-1,6-bisphosphatase/inositol monophosphatase family enzyme